MWFFSLSPSIAPSLALSHSLISIYWRKLYTVNVFKLNKRQHRTVYTDTKWIWKQLIGFAVSGTRALVLLSGSWHWIVSTQANEQLIQIYAYVNSGNEHSNCLRYVNARRLTMQIPIDGNIWCAKQSGYFVENNYNCAFESDEICTECWYLYGKWWLYGECYLCGKASNDAGNLLKSTLCISYFQLPTSSIFIRNFVVKMSF